MSGVLQFMGSERSRHDWATEQQRYHLNFLIYIHLIYFNRLEFMLNEFLSFLSRPHWSLKSLNFLVFEGSQDDAAFLYQS